MQQKISFADMHKFLILKEYGIAVDISARGIYIRCMIMFIFRDR